MIVTIAEQFTNDPSDHERSPTIIWKPGLSRIASHKREMLHKQTKNYLFIRESAEMSPCEIRSLLDYDRGQYAESSYLKFPMQVSL